MRFSTLSTTKRISIILGCFLQQQSLQSRHWIEDNMFGPIIHIKGTITERDSKEFPDISRFKDWSGVAIAKLCRINGRYSP